VALEPPEEVAAQAAAQEREEQSAQVECREVQEYLW
jgi:hypothetical protein